ncbi:MAG: precorrin-2 C(20)-methyltransferase [Acidimicrobiales bacterium]
MSPADHPPHRPPGRLTGVGVGPGDPELLTTRALRVLREADKVVAPTTAPGAVGRAEDIVRRADPGICIERLVFDMGASRDTSQEQAADHLLSILESGDDVAFVTLGDPNVYSTFSSLVAALRQRRHDLVVETIPGIMAFQELASRAGIVVLDGTERLALVTALDGTADLQAALEDENAAVVVYKGGRHLPEIARLVKAAGRADNAVFGELLGLPGEQIREIAGAGDGPVGYLATVIVPPARRRAPR